MIFVSRKGRIVVFFNESKRMVARILFLLFAFSAVAGCSAAKSNPAPAGGKIQVVAAENFYGEVAQAVGGDHVQVTSILSNSIADPEGFEPTVEEAKAVSQASVVIYNGLGYDSWINKLLNASARADRVQIAVGTDITGHKEGDNVHIWYDVSTMPRLADALAERFGRLDPEHQDEYRKNAEAYKKKLEPLQQKIQSLRQTKPVPIDVSEPVFDYMAQALNLQPKNTRFETAVFNGVDPSPADVQQMESDLQKKQVRLFIYNEKTKNQEVDRFVQMAKQSGVPVVSVTEQEPEGKDYLTWMMDQLNELERAIRGQ
jgi:zinc/manganese transport system substrate-binding protein